MKFNQYSSTKSIKPIHLVMNHVTNCYYSHLKWYFSKHPNIVNMHFSSQQNQYLILNKSHRKTALSPFLYSF